jgi:cytochrome c oxidase subunit III
MSIVNLESMQAEAVQHSSHETEDHRLFGFIVFLLSESVIFFSFFVGYIVYKTNATDWLPEGFEGLEIHDPLINTIVLVSSSFVLYFGERFLHRKNLWGFRVLWLLTMAMGSFFLYGQAVEWRSLPFGFTSGVFGGTFYLLTGFHGLHVLTGILLQGVMLGRSLIPNNYAGGEYGVEATSLFWHFVDVIWILLFLLIYVWQ